MRQLLTILMMALLWLPRTAQATNLPEDKSSAVVLSYSRIGEEAYSATNLRIDQFNAHLAELKTQRYNVMPLPSIIDAIKNGQALPAHTIAITFSGAFKSAYENAMKPLIAAKIPFTIFYASDNADAQSQQHLSWPELKSLKQSGLVTFGLLPASYTRLSGASETQMRTQINKARTRHREKLDIAAPFFSYPFGEYSARYRDEIKSQGFTAAFGLHSGSIHQGADLFTLPRFPMTQSYGSIDRFEMVANALPLPANDIEPQDPYLATDQPPVGFTIKQALKTELSSLSCFVSGQGQPQIETLGENRIELRLKEPLTEERTRINCTIPAGKDRWRWLGMLLVRKIDVGNNAETELPIPQQGALP